MSESMKTKYYVEINTAYGKTQVECTKAVQDKIAMEEYMRSAIKVRVDQYIDQLEHKIIKDYLKERK